MFQISELHRKRLSSLLAECRERDEEVFAVEREAGRWQLSTRIPSDTDIPLVYFGRKAVLVATPSIAPLFLNGSLAIAPNDQLQLQGEEPNQR